MRSGLGSWRVPRYVSRGRSEEKVGEHMWYGDGRIGEAVRTGQGEKVGEKVGVREAGNNRFNAT